MFRAFLPLFWIGFSSLGLRESIRISLSRLRTAGGDFQVDSRSRKVEKPIQNTRRRFGTLVTRRGVSIEPNLMWTCSRSHHADRFADRTNVCIFSLEKQELGRRDFHFAVIRFGAVRAFGHNSVQPMGSKERGASVGLTGIRGLLELLPTLEPCTCPASGRRPRSLREVRPRIRKGT